MEKNYKPTIEFRNVEFSYPGSEPLFQKLFLKFKKGQFYLINGDSGAGKSTLLKLMNRLEDPVEGDILFNRKPLTEYTPQALRRRILYIQQVPVVVEGSVRDNLQLPFTFKENRKSEKSDDASLSTLMNTFRLTGIRLDDNAQSLSVGQRQRICLIRGLLLSPDVVLMDEPTSALDEESSRVVDVFVEKLCRESGRTIIMVSHRKFISESVFPMILKMEAGKLIEV